MYKIHKRDDSSWKTRVSGAKRINNYAENTKLARINISTLALIDAYRDEGKFRSRSAAIEDMINKSKRIA